MLIEPNNERMVQAASPNRQSFLFGNTPSPHPSPARFPHFFIAAGSIMLIEPNN